MSGSRRASWWRSSRERACSPSSCTGRSSCTWDRHPQGPRGSARAVVAGRLGRPRPRRTSRSTSFSRTSSGRSTTRSPSPTPWSATRRRGCSGRAPRRRCSATTCSSCSPTRWRSPAPTCWRASSGWAGGERRSPGRRSPSRPSAWSRTATCRSSPAAGSRWPSPLGLRGYRLRRPAWVIAGWAVAAWQLSVGFTLGLPLAYLLATVWLIAVVVWLRAGRPRLARGLAIATVVGAAIFLAAGLLLSRPYVRVADAHPGAHRTPADVAAFSGPPLDLPGRARREPGLGRRHVAASGRAGERPGEDPVPGPRDRSPWRSPAFPRPPIRAGCGEGSGSGWWRSSSSPSGSREGGGLLWPYRVVYELLPGWQAIRVPGRLVTFSSLGLGAARRGGSAAGDAGRRRAQAVRVGEAATAIAALLVAAVVIEGRGLPFDPFDNQAQPEVSPRCRRPWRRVAAPQLHLPAERAERQPPLPAVVDGRLSRRSSTGARA